MLGFRNGVVIYGIIITHLHPNLRPENVNFQSNNRTVFTRGSFDFFFFGAKQGGLDFFFPTSHDELFNFEPGVPDIVPSPKRHPKSYINCIRTYQILYKTEHRGR